MRDHTRIAPEDLIARSGLFAGMNPFMAVASMVMIIAFVAFTISDVDYANSVFTVGKDFIINSLDWFYCQSASKRDPLSAPKRDPCLWLHRVSARRPGALHLAQGPAGAGCLSFRL